MAFAKMCSDTEISGKIFYQYCMLIDAVSLDKEKKEQLLGCIIEVTKKLERVKYHQVNMLNILQKCLEKSQPKDKGNTIEVDLTSGVESEFEAFIMQGKSTLDVLVKVLNPLLNIKLSTFGKGGENVINALNNNLKKSELDKAQTLKEIIENDRDWIEKWFKKDRDTITHYMAVVSTGIIAYKDENGDINFRFPETKDGVPFHMLAQRLYGNLLGFCEDFIPASMYIKLWPGISLQVVPDDQKDSKFPVKYRLV